jgi:hypothetical protein
MEYDGINDCNATSI